MCCYDNKMDIIFFNQWNFKELYFLITEMLFCTCTEMRTWTVLVVTQNNNIVTGSTNDWRHRKVSDEACKHHILCCSSVAMGAWLICCVALGLLQAGET